MTMFVVREPNQHVIDERLLAQASRVLDARDGITGAGVIIALVAAVIDGGKLHMASEALALKPARLNPVTGLGRLFKLRNGAELLQSLVFATAFLLLALAVSLPALQPF